MQESTPATVDTIFRQHQGIMLFDPSKARITAAETDFRIETSEVNCG
jgi:hypothetical protein